MTTVTTIRLERPEHAADMDYWQDYYPALEAARENVWEQYQAVASDVQRQVKLRVVLVYAEPVELYHAGRKRYQTAREHEVRRLFQRDGKIYYIPTACRTRGYRLSWHELVEIRVLTEEKDYSAEWAHIAKEMRRHNVNLALARQIEEHLAGQRDEFYYRTFRSRPTKMSFEDVTRGRTLTQMWEQAVESKGQRFFYERTAGERRDRSVSLTRTRDGWWRYTGASEYAGMGNGDYYIMYSPTMGFHGERD